MKEQDFLAANFYRFARLNHEDLLVISKDIKDVLAKNNIKGTILLAQEGINCTIAGLPNDLKLSINFIKNIREEFRNFDIKYSNTQKNPFRYLKVKIKKEIVTLKQENVDPSSKTGILVDAKDWNKILLDENFLVIDTRNDYEIKLGSFKNAVYPNTKKFSQFPDFIKQKLIEKKNLKIAMFCTGGIRCEKASSLMLDQGFKEVYQLNGGILRYLEKIPENKSLWQGDCFVFDERNSI